MRIFRLLILVAVFAASAEARIGDKLTQFADRYGPPKDTPADRSPDPSTALVPGAIHHTYEYQGWKIRAAFLELDGGAVRMDYSKLPLSGTIPQIQDAEVGDILKANMPTGTNWKSGNFVASVTGKKSWQRSDGALLWLLSDQVVRVELPAARERDEKVKREKNEKGKTPVPQF